MTLDDKITQAERHVDSGRRIIERQRVIVARLGQPFAADLLDAFEKTQQIFEMDLADLLTDPRPASGLWFPHDLAERRRRADPFQGDAGHPAHP